MDSGLERKKEKMDSTSMYEEIGWQVPLIVAANYCPSSVSEMAWRHLLIAGPTLFMQS